MSQQFHGSQQQHNRNRRKEDESDALMRLVSQRIPKQSNDAYSSE